MHRLAIGGIGGSGTRVLAKFAQTLGYFIGDDLNDSLDNLWFTLLFKRRSILAEPLEKFQRLLSAFYARMDGRSISVEDRDIVYALTEQAADEPKSWLRARASSFLAACPDNGTLRPWAWKEPNTHLLIDRILAFDPGLRYLHVDRHPLDMSVNSNQNQTRRWGPVLLDRDCDASPRDSLAYWCRAYRRRRQIMAHWPDRTASVDFDDFTRRFNDHFEEVLKFLNARASKADIADFKTYLDPPPALRRQDLDLAQYDEQDIAYIKSIGYRLD